MLPVSRLRCPRGLYLRSSTLSSPRICDELVTRHVHHHDTLSSVSCQIQRRGAKTTSKRKVKELAQGVIAAEPLIVQEPPKSPQYSPVLEGVRKNMVKFDKCVILTRVGNFYELYFEHAEEYGPLLGLKVARKRTSSEEPVAMSGFPYWQLDRFLKILVQDLNKYVAISEEFPIDTPERIKSGGLWYERRVARVVTPGTLIAENFLDPYQNNFLLAIEIDGDATSAEYTPSGELTDSLLGLAWLDLSTGEFFTQSATSAHLPSILTRLRPREILLSSHASDTLREHLEAIVGQAHELITLHDAASGFTTMLEWNSKLEIPVNENADDMFSMQEKLAGHRLLDYICISLQDLQLQLRPPQRKEQKDMLVIDRGSLRGLEILETAKDGLGKGSLFHAVKRTVTKGGSRLLRDRLSSPSTSLPEINGRLDLVSRFCDSENLREGIVYCLRKTFDVKRLVQKFATNKGNADDMLCLARAVTETSRIYELIKSNIDDTAGQGKNDPLHLVLNRFNITGPIELSSHILNAIDEDGVNEKHELEEDEASELAELVQDSILKTAPEELESLPKKPRPKYRTSSARAHYEENEDPWIMRRAASETLDRLHSDLETLKQARQKLQERLQIDFGTSKFELKWTPGLGHICHVTSAKSLRTEIVDTLDARVISSSKSTRSLQLPAWSDLGQRLANARLNIRDEESRIFRQLRQEIIDNIVFLRRNAIAIDELDVATSFATLAQEQGWSRPILNSGADHKIVAGRHPTVKLGLEEQGRSFVSNDLFLDNTERIWVVTGPNMAGKSTFLRQNALITILAQTGSYVPAEYAELGVVDQVFSRIGAADDLFRDQSTFMVEMLETAAILKYATPRSFVIMDEVGRGTTPEDGTAVSFSSLHHLHQINRCRTLFATHFHGLLDMTEDWNGIGRYCTDVLETASGSFSFVHKLRPGVNRQSHALKVAKMAGLPKAALDVAYVVQKQLMERKQQSHSESDKMKSAAIGSA